MLFSIESPKLFYTGSRSLTINAPIYVENGLTAIVGDNGAGKSTLARIIEGGWNYRTNRIIPYQNHVKTDVKYVEFNDVHSWCGDAVGYYQQRYEATMNDDVPSVSDIMGERVGSTLFKHYARLLDLHDVKEKKINYLSSGELRKLLLINALLNSPELLIIDNPYIGLDSASRDALMDAFRTLRDNGPSIMLVVSDADQIPEFVDNTIYVDGLSVSPTPLNNEKKEVTYRSFGFKEVNEHGAGLPIIEMDGCTVKYGQRTVLDNVKWNVYGGERWSLTGANGSGKSTLLSLVCADNPKGYSSPISIFGKKRGSGESIWDIKKNIGYVSPEMKLGFRGSGTVSQILANGLNDTVGMYIAPTEEQLECAERWLRHFDMSHLGDRQFSTLSSGERQMVLVARAMIKEPRLLILDEPMHALDRKNRRTVENTVDEFTRTRPDAALIMVTHYLEELPSTTTHNLNLIRHVS